MHARLTQEPALKPLSGQELRNKMEELQNVLQLIRNRLSAYRLANNTELIQEDRSETDEVRTTS